MKKQTVVPLLSDTYLAALKNSIGSDLFKNFYAKVDGKKKDIMKNGDLSCAFYVSSMLVIFKLAEEIHATVCSTVKDLKGFGWKTAKKPRPGSVIVWEEVDFGKDDIHKHIGFYIGNGHAISNSSKSGHPVQHHWTFKSKRRVEMILWNAKLE